MLPYIQDLRGFESSTEPKLSAGLRTPRPPLFNTCVYTIVVLTSLCPNSSWTVRISYPSSSRWVAKEWRVLLAGSRDAFPMASAQRSRWKFLLVIGAHSRPHHR